MSHLPTERLAALSDEAPTAEELAHLASCGECARERATFRVLAELAVSESTRIGAPLTSWERLAPALIADGIIDDGRVELGRRTPRRARRAWLQAAAAAILVAGGTMLGRYSAGASVVPVASKAAPTASAPRFASIADAKAAQAQSYSLYQTATAFLAQRDTSNMAPNSPGAIRTRLAALDRANAVMGEALNEAPYDPVINNYYLSTQGQREATIRQLNTVMPASMRIQSY
jgi:hypothetical protein